MNSSSEITSSGKKANKTGTPEQIAAVTEQIKGMSHKCEHGKDSDICVLCAEEFHVPLETGKARPLGAQNANLGRGAGRPPKNGETATGHIHIRTTMKRKSAYIRAAKPKKLTEWIFENLDKAAGHAVTAVISSKNSHNHQPK